MLLLIALAAASGYFIGIFPEAWMNFAAIGGGALAAVFLGIVPILTWLSSRSTITTKRIIIRRGLLVHHRWEVPLSRVREVRLRRGPIQRLFGSGDVRLVTSGEAPLVLRDVPGPGAIVDALHELIEQGYQRDVQSSQQQPPQYSLQHPPQGTGTGQAMPFAR